MSLKPEKDEKSIKEALAKLFHGRSLGDCSHKQQREIDTRYRTGRYPKNILKQC